MVCTPTMSECLWGFLAARRITLLRLAKIWESLYNGMLRSPSFRDSSVCMLMVDKRADDTFIIFLLFYSQWTFLLSQRKKLVVRQITRMSFAWHPVGISSNLTSSMPLNVSYVVICSWPGDISIPGFGI
jgi:hypothetical protein